VLEHMDFAAAYKDGARSEVERLRAAGILSDEEAASVDAAAVDGLLRSDIGSRLLAAAKLNREFRFSVLLPAEEFFPAGTARRSFCRALWTAGSRRTAAWS
jgi:ATP-dependent helicase/nuclease subunit A